MDQFVSYNGLPISSGGAHGLGKKSALEAFTEVITFLQKYGSTTKPETVSLTLYKADSFDYRKLKWQFMKRYGLFPKDTSVDFIKYKQKMWTWDLKPKQMEEAISILQENSDLPEVDHLGPLRLEILWHVRLMDPTTQMELPNQKMIPTLDFRIHNSRMLLTVSKKSRVSVWFAFPFANQDETFKTYLNAFIKDLPFQPSEKHWRTWEKNKHGEWMPKKITV